MKTPKESIATIRNKLQLPLSILEALQGGKKPTPDQVNLAVKELNEAVRELEKDGE